MEEVAGGLVDRLWPQRARTVTSLAHGITNSNFLVDLGDERVVVRVPGKDTGLLGIDRDVEVLAGELAASIGVGPELLALDAATGCIVTRFIDGRPVGAEELASEPMLSHFAATLRLVHAAGTIPAVFDPATVVAGYRAEASDRGVAVPFDVDAAFEVLARIAEARPFRATVLGHNDLLNANFLYDGRLRIVDWEYAGMADPFFDLANAAVNNGFAPESERRLLELYFGFVDEHVTATFELMKVVSELREAMWGVMQLAISSLDVDFASYAGERGRHALALAEGLDLDGLLAAARGWREP